MDKLIPDPPTTPETEAEDLRAETLLKDREAIKRALDYYLDPPSQYTEKPRRPSTMYMIARTWTPKACWPKPASHWHPPVS